MTSNEEIFKRFQYSLGEIKGHLHVLESSVPVEKQMEYFHYSEDVRKRKQGEEVHIEDEILILHAPESTEMKKKCALVRLAGSADVAAYRALEAYAKNPDIGLEDWSKMSLLEARIALEAEFSDEKQVYISTGLGGKEDKLRFFALFKSRNLIPFSPYQKELIEREFLFYMSKNEGEIESLEVKENYISLVFLINLGKNIKVVLDEAFHECNEYGDFIDTNYLVTNVKIYTEEEIQKEINKN